MNLRDHTLAWLDSIGADGLMYLESGDVLEKDGIAMIKDDDSTWYGPALFFSVPAYRHADGSYHAEKEAAKDRGVNPEQIVVEE